jgi:SAM-dependent methyltransferase
MKSVSPYSSLAAVYDAVMAHVDYEGWADYLLHLVDDYIDPAHGEEALKALELGAGTGLLTEELLHQSSLTMTVTDGAADMLAVARERLGSVKERTAFEQVDFSREWAVDGSPFDLQFLLYDGFNYLMHPDQVSALFEGVRRAGKPGSLFLFDQSTPHNSINNAEFFEDEGSDGDFSYHRKSSFDQELGIHTTEFDIDGPNGRFSEVHRQRAWTRGQVLDLLGMHDLEVVAAFDGFSLDDAHDEAERIHWVIRIPG